MSGATDKDWDVALEAMIDQRCSDCGTLRHLPRYQCAECGSTAYEWAHVTGRGTLYSWTVTHQIFHPAFDVPFVAAVIELDEGVRFVSQLIDADPAQLELDAPVRVTFKRVTDDFQTPVFRLEKT